MADSPAVLIQRWFDEVWNQDNESAIHSLMAPHVRTYGLAPGAIEGADQFREFYRGFRGAFDRVEVALDHVQETGDHVAYRGRAVVTMRGDGKRYEFEGAGFARFEDGRIVEGWNYWDFLGLLVQSGAVPGDAMQSMMLKAAAAG